MCDPSSKRPGWSGPGNGVTSHARGFFGVLFFGLVAIVAGLIGYQARPEPRRRPRPVERVVYVGGGGWFPGFGFLFFLFFLFLIFSFAGRRRAWGGGHGHWGSGYGRGPWGGPTGTTGPDASSDPRRQWIADCHRSLHEAEAKAGRAHHAGRPGDAHHPTDGRLTTATRQQRRSRHESQDPRSPVPRLPRPQGRRAATIRDGRRARSAGAAHGRRLASPNDPRRQWIREFHRSLHEADEAEAADTQARPATRHRPRTPPRPADRPLPLPHATPGGYHRPASPRLWSPMRTILVVEDEPQIAALVRDYLEHAGFAVLTATDGAAGLTLARVRRPDAVVLDLGLPVVDGLDVVRTLRRDSMVPIVILTARGDETDRVTGLELGADDYVVKPFSPKELVARVRAVLRRAENAARPAERLVVGDLELDLARHRVAVAWPGHRADARPSSSSSPPSRASRGACSRAASCSTRSTASASRRTSGRSTATSRTCAASSSRTWPLPVTC